MMGGRGCAAKGAALRSLLLAALRTIEEDPDEEVVAEILEAVLDPGGREEKISGFEGMALAGVEVGPSTLSHKINLVARVRSLRICFPGCVHFHFQRAMAED